MWKPEFIPKDWSEKDEEFKGKAEALMAQLRALVQEHGEADLLVSCCVKSRGFGVNELTPKAPVCLCLAVELLHVGETKFFQRIFSHMGPMFEGKTPLFVDLKSYPKSPNIN